MFSCSNIYKSFYDRSSKKNFMILNNCSMRISENQVVGLMGSSGCGKSTLARVLLRLLQPDSGKICFQGEDITNCSQKQLRSFRQQVQFISQRPENAFDPLMKLRDSLLEPCKVFDKTVHAEAVSEILEKVKLNSSVLERYPHQVSGGEIQRVSIARSLLLQPKLMILDEPTSMLDISVQAQILHLLRTLHYEDGLSYLLVSHDKRVIDWLSDECLVMKDGVIGKHK